MLGNGDNTVLRMLGSPNRVSLGSGGFGTVITTEEDPHLALKISKDVNVCFKWKNEYKTQKSVYDGYDSKGKAVRVVEPLKFAYIEENRCYILMQRVCPPNGFDERIAIHALTGDIDKDELDVKRGRFVGQEFLKDYIDLERVAVDLGKFLATVHFKLGLDGQDLEYILGRRCGKDLKPWINVIDFGYVGKYNREDAVLSIDALPYFPLSYACKYVDCTSEQHAYNALLSNLFSTSYISEAKKYNKGDEANIVISIVSE